MRLQKFLSSAGVCSRRKGEEYIKNGRIKVNGRIITQPGTKVDPDIDQVEIDSRQVCLEENIVYIAMNKPLGYVTTCEQPGDKIIMDIIDIPERVYPAGRLDKDSTGLLLLTNDGSLHHRLLHPSFDHEKEYEVTVGRPISEGALRKLGKGMPLMGTKTRTAQIRRLSSNRFRIVLKEGKNRQIRRMVRKVGEHVAALKRIRIANIRLGSLDEGKWRYLTEKEKKELLNNQQ
ncbi:Pseudouridine synthase [Desulfonema limicola]|uniref:Pseudouridine synthase n=2 Tax=Desulfonema limicola TaxID=45656 RepID=A0A975GIF9_9BACT|nr:Pseudouridine synthase [Desulfonema limicola]